jgi:hypothetical protein
MGVFKMEWKIGEEMCGCVGLHHFLLMMIFWRHGNLNLVCFKVCCACVVVVTLQHTNNRTWPITT